MRQRWERYRDIAAATLTDDKPWVIFARGVLWVTYTFNYGILAVGAVVTAMFLIREAFKAEAAGEPFLPYLAVAIIARLAAWWGAQAMYIGRDLFLVKPMERRDE